jgi:hypothetical protein
MRRQGKNTLPPFVPLTWELLNSPAYKKLSHSSAKLLPLFLGKVKRSLRDAQYLQDTFTFTFSEGHAFGYARKTFYRVVQALSEAGFIDIVEVGGLRGAGKTASRFKLSNRWRDYGKASFINTERKRIIEKQIQRQVYF